MAVTAYAEGVQQVAPSADDLVMLLIGNADFGDFANHNGPESSRLYIDIQSPDETLYLGLSREFSQSGNPSTPGTYRFQLRRASDGAIVHGPFNVNSFLENVSSWEEAIGPDVIYPGQGYATDDERYVFQPEEAGLYYIEFLSADFIGLWDFTVANGTTPISGRVYSKNWAFRTPTAESSENECVWDRDFNGTLYSYTNDGFVTRINFMDSGFQGLSFTVAFNTRGPGQTGDIELDRMSVPNANVTTDFAEHLIFLDEPDPLAFPDGNCGQVDVAPFFECVDNDAYCLDINVTEPGQVEVLLDFNRDNVFDPSEDVRLLHRFNEGEPLNFCLPWGGTTADGTLVDPGATINLIVRYTQGVQHWALFDGEYLKEGFCVEPVRPNCGSSLTDILYWDDRNIDFDPGTGQPLDGRAGCACAEAGCRTWNTFSVNRECNDLDDDATTGYGDKSTLNTWWFANVVSVDRANVPLITLEITGEDTFCEGNSTELGFVFTSSADIASITWEGPGGVLFDGPNAPRTINADEPGTYTLTIVDGGDCSYTATQTVGAENCATDVELDISVNDATPDIGQSVNFTINYANTHVDIATGIEITATLPAGLSDATNISGNGQVVGNTIVWSGLSMASNTSGQLTFSASVVTAFDYTVSAEVTAMDQPDIDSTPANGVDTNNNGDCSDDPGDEDDGDCVVLVPTSCAISASVSNINCDPRGTLEDGSDDTYTFRILVEGSNGSGSWSGTVGTIPIRGQYGEPAVLGPFPISSGGRVLNIHDDFYTESCTTSVTVEAPAPCSNNCTISAEQRNITCQDAGTPTIGEDDTFTVEVRVTGSNTGDNWQGTDGTIGNYEEWIVLGPYLISDGIINYDFVDSGNSNCIASLSLDPPPNCSTTCAIEAMVGAAVCDPQGTTSDDSDDTYTVAVTISGFNTGNTWSANDPLATSGNYEEQVVFGPYAISDGPITVVVTDDATGTCQTSFELVPPATCSDECSISIQQRNISCFDNNTPTDNSDDVFTVEVFLTGDNTGSGWDAFGGVSGNYDEWTTIGPFAISEGNVSLNFVDNADRNCTVATEFVAPPPCSTTCAIEANTSNIRCEDNGTPSDPSDDQFYFTLLVTGVNNSSSWTANDPLASSGDYGTAVELGPYAVADGDLSLEIADADVAACVTTVDVLAPSTCSDQCIIDAITQVGFAVCDDNGTPSIAEDDTFTFTVVVSGRNTDARWEASNGQSGNYNVETTLGPFLIIDGTVELSIFDAADDNCSSSISIAPPRSCSLDCEITSVAISQVICDNNDTPTDTSDDTFTFVAELEGRNVGDSWNTNIGVSGAYTTLVTFGPYAIADGEIDLVFTDVGTAGCSSSIVVIPPNTCSTECAFSATATNVICFDNNTPANPNDDTYTFDLLVTSINNTATTWQSSIGSSGEYGIVYPQGPFLIALGDISWTISDGNDGSCSTELAVTAPPVCSDECALEVELISVDCHDNGTFEDASDDTYTYTVIVTGQNNSDTWEASDGTSGTFGVPVTSDPIPYSIAGIDITVEDRDGRCTDMFVAAPLAPALFCPEDTDQRITRGGVQIIRGNLSESDDSFSEVPCFLAARSNPITVGDRFFDAIIIWTPEDNDTSDVVYSFHLFSKIEDLSGTIDGGRNDGAGVLVRGNYQTYDDPCCYSMNYPGEGEETDIDITNPSFDASALVDEDYELVQKFRQRLKMGEQLTLTASTLGAGNTGEYAWVVVAEISDSLRLDPMADATSEFTPNELVTYDLTHFNIQWAMNNEESLDALGRAEVEPLCGVDSLYFNDDLDFLDDCENALVHRTFVMDYGAQSDSCEQVLTFRRPDIDDVILPPSSVNLDCGDDFEVDEFGNPTPVFTGYPLYDSGDSLITMFDNTVFFGLAVSVKDLPPVTTEDLELNFTREWELTDVCNGDVKYTFNQQIKIGDFHPPVLSCPLSNHYCPIVEEDIMLFDVNPDDCIGAVEIPEADFRGFCNEARAAEWTIQTELLTAIDSTVLDTLPEVGSRTVTNLNRGDYLIRYSATHLNGERVEQVCRMRISDLQPPVALCENITTVDLAELENDQLLATRFDRGSYDNCGIMSFSVRRAFEDDIDCTPLDERAFSDWLPSIDFTCCDIDRLVAVDFRIMDVDSNINGCTFQVLITDSSEPTLQGLEPMILDCNSLPTDFDPLDSLQRNTLFGEPAIVNACNEFLVELEPSVAWTDCEVASVARVFRVENARGDQLGPNYEQRITFNQTPDYAFRLPADGVTACLEELPPLEWVGRACSNFTISHTDETLPAEGEECFRIARTYSIVDNCKFVEGSNPMIIGRDADCDAILGEAKWLVVNNDQAFVDADADAMNTFPAADSRGAACGTSNPTGYWQAVDNAGYWQYTQYIAVEDALAPQVIYDAPDPYCTTSAACSAMVDIAVVIEEYCMPDDEGLQLLFDSGSDGNIDVDLTDSEVLQGSWPNYNLRGEFAVGDHRFELRVTDACGNSTVEQIAFSVVDCYIETPVCAINLEVQLTALDVERDVDGDGIIDEAAAMLSAENLASMLNADCSRIYAYSVNDVGATVDFNADELILTCEDRYLKTVEVVVRDAANNPYAMQPDGTMGGPNYSKCLVQVSVQDDERICRACVANQLEIQGAVIDKDEQPINGVIVQLKEEEGVSVQVEPVDGQFQFTDLTLSNDYEVQPFKNDDVAAGITTVDMIILLRHINEIELITDPYILLAADINASGTITNLDFLLLRELLLERIEEFPGNTSWRFVPRDYQITDIAQPIPDRYQYFNLLSCQLAQDFIGIKVGDLDGSLSQSGSRTAPGQVASRNDLPVELPDIQLHAGQQAIVPITMANLSALTAVDMNLAWDTDLIEVQELIPAKITSDNLVLSKGQVRAIWLGLGQPKAAAEEVLFTLVVHAKQATSIAEVLHLVEAEEVASFGFSQQLEAYPLYFHFNIEDIDWKVTASPDPFQSQTTLNFAVPHSGKYQLEIHDVTGRLVEQQALQYDLGGSKSLTIDGANWPSGLLHYRIIGDDIRLSGRFVKL